MSRSKKIGILFGSENIFPSELAKRINQKNEDGIIAEFVKIEKIFQGKPAGYDVIIDRISNVVPFYRSFLKNEGICGTAVINNPFWLSAGENFFNNALMSTVNISVPRTVLLPSNKPPVNTDEDSFRNLSYPLNWDEIFEYVGFPALLKPVYSEVNEKILRVENRDEFFNNYHQTFQRVMMLQEEIKFNEYFRCYCIDRSHVRVIKYDPAQLPHLKYLHHPASIEEELLANITEIVLVINYLLGLDFNTVDIAVRDNIPFAVDFLNPVPETDIEMIGKNNFEWLVENAANMAIRKALEFKPERNNLTWGKFITQFVNNKNLII